LNRLPVWNAAARALRKRRSVVFGYHGVGEPHSRLDPHFLRVAPDRLAAQIELLRDAGFRFVTVAELAELGDGGAPPPGYAALSFDDGMEDNHSQLLPILERYDIPATVYVSTGLIGQSNPWLAEGTEARMMTRDEIVAVARAGVEIGAHTVTHPDMSELDREACRREMADSRDELAELTGEPVRTFAYPFCRYGPEAIEAARDVGFLAAVTGEGRGGWQPYELNRAMITGKDGMASFLLKASELYQPLFDSAPGRAFRVSTRAVRRQARALAERRG
jgi:peptidoglycan/xylan/chitin deacetylase (PgdA/CDA1 family)